MEYLITALQKPQKSQDLIQGIFATIHFKISCLYIYF